MNDLKEFTQFVVTGKYYNSKKRFRSIYSSFQQAILINIWNGSIFGVRKNGTRKLLKRVVN